MKEEFTTKMHSEMRVSKRIDILNRCITLWCYCGIESEDDPEFPELCKKYGLSQKDAIKHKDYCLELAGNSETKHKNQ